jgi:hypothetical protein
MVHSVNRPLTGAKVATAACQRAIFLLTGPTLSTFLILEFSPNFGPPEIFKARLLCICPLADILNAANMIPAMLLNACADYGGPSIFRRICSSLKKLTNNKIMCTPQHNTPHKLRRCMMLVLPTCYLKVLNMINSTPFPFFQNPSRIVELQDLQCNHGFNLLTTNNLPHLWSLDGTGDFLAASCSASLGACGLQPILWSHFFFFFLESVFRGTYTKERGNCTEL